MKLTKLFGLGHLFAHDSLFSSFAINFLSTKSIPPIRELTFHRGVKDGRARDAEQCTVILSAAKDLNQCTVVGTCPSRSSLGAAAWLRSFVAALLRMTPFRS
jgi:hypothetical protein